MACANPICAKKPAKRNAMAAMAIRPNAPGSSKRASVAMKANWQTAATTVATADQPRPDRICRAFMPGLAE